MLTLKELQDRLAMNEWPLRRLIDAVAPLLQGQLHRKPGQPLQVDSAALGLLDRAKVLFERGTPRSHLVEVLQGELQGLQRSAANTSADVSNYQQIPLQSPTAPSAELVDVLKRQVDDLRGERDRLLGLLEQGAQAALPASTQSHQRLGRWAALRAVVSGIV